MQVAVSAARWVVGKALDPVTDGFLEAWAASAGLGANIDALKMELLYAQGMLDNAHGRDIRSTALKELLHKLRQLAYGADDVLDELEYFRIQDVLDGTYHAADVHAGGCVRGLGLNARHTARAVASKLNISSCSRDASRGDPDEQAKQGCLSGICSCGGQRTPEISYPPPNNQAEQEVAGGCMPKVTSSARNTAQAIGKHIPCCSLTSVGHGAHTSMTRDGHRSLCGAWPCKVHLRNRAMQTPKLKFDRVEISKKMKDIAEHLKPVCAKVSTILNLELLGSSRTIAMNRPKTTPEIIEPKLYGRDVQKKEIIDGITHDKYCKDEPMTVLPIVGPGGIGKTAFTQHIYEEVKSHFQVSVWVCVSLDFNANRLVQEIVKKIPEVDNENKTCSKEELIEQRIKSKRFLLVLDDVWTYHEDEWKKLLAPFRKGGGRGNIVIVTTRIPHVANMVKTIECPIELQRLGHEDTMSFFEVCVFDDQQPLKDPHHKLHYVGLEIVGNLKGFPLEVKTVGRLLRNQLTLDHWTRVLKSKEWELQTSENDIMPALKLSYDYLPFHLQQCFSYCALFPEDYEFDEKELVHLWIGLGILHPYEQKKRIEDVGMGYLIDLVNHGFFKKNEKEGERPNYVIHDLLHDLAVKVSSYEFLSIYSSNVRSIQIPPSVRHLSIIIDDTVVEDRMTFEDYKKDLSALDKRLNVENLHTLMLFGEYHGSFAKTFGDLFREARALRTIFLSGASYNVEDLLQNFSKLVHLRYLRIRSMYDKGLCLPSSLFRFYHLEVIDLEEWQGRFDSTRYMSNLVKLRHFLVPKNNRNLHSNIFEVGKLKFLQELRGFRVREESKGFELSQLGQLTKLGGSLNIYNLEMVQGKEEANEFKLIQKNHLQELKLEWDIDQPCEDPTQQEIVLESLVPHGYLQHLCIVGHRGNKCPTWLHEKLSVKSLESLRLHDVSWKNLPPLGELWFTNDLGEECQGIIPGQSFHNLRRLELVRIRRLTKWVGNGTCHLFSHLKVLIIQHCPELVELLSPYSTCCQPKQEENITTWFPRLQELRIEYCPKLLSLPPIPWTRDSSGAYIARVGLGFDYLSYSKNYKSQTRLKLDGKNGQDSMFWNHLAFYNLTELKELEIENCPPLRLDHLNMLTSLKILRISRSTNLLSPAEGGSHVICKLPVEDLRIKRCRANGKELTQLLSLLPNLSKLSILGCLKITGLGVVGAGRQTAATPASSSPSSANKMEHAQAGLLLLPPQLQDLEIDHCPGLSLLPNAAAGGGLQGLHTLRSLEIRGCPKFLSSYLSSSSPCFPFPTSLQDLDLQDLALRDVEGMETLNPLSNLTSLTELATGDVTGVLVAPICSVLSSSLTTLIIFSAEVERFTVEQEEALRLLTSLQKLRFCFCDRLQHLPAGLASLQELEIHSCSAFKPLPKDSLPASLQRLVISGCSAFKSLPKDSLPASLQKLGIHYCSAFKSLPKDSLPASLQKLEIWGCSAFESLPKNGLPSSLRELDVGYSGSEELKRQCHKLKGTIPIIRGA